MSAAERDLTHDPRTDAGLDHVAKLARLELDPSQRDAVRVHMERVLGWVEALEQVDVEGVSANLHDEPWPSERLRPDEVRPSLPREAALRNAPKANEVGFVLPRVVSE